MATMTDPRRPQSPQARLPDVRSVSSLDPQYVRVVEIDGSGAPFRRDCYDPDGGLVERNLTGIQDLLHTVGGRLYLCAIDWARTSSLNPSVELHWVSTEMRVTDVNQIRVFSWPDGDLVRVFKHSP